jgi:hypothetical protein
MIAFTLAFFHFGSYYFFFRGEFQPLNRRISMQNYRSISGPQDQPPVLLDEAVF